MKRTLVALMLLSLMVPLASKAQETFPVKPGDRIRVTSSECFQETQHLVFSSISSDTLWATSKKQDVGCPTSLISGMEVFRPTSVLKTSGYGLLIGAVGGALLGLPTEPCGGDCGCDCRQSAMAAGGIVGAGSGLLVGGLIGLTHTPGRWKEAGIPSFRLAAMVTPGSRLNLGVSIPMRR